MTAGLGVPSTLTWNGSSSTAPEMPAGVASIAMTNAAARATTSSSPVRASGHPSRSGSLNAGLSEAGGSIAGVALQQPYTEWPARLSPRSSVACLWASRPSETAAWPGAARRVHRRHLGRRVAHRGRAGHGSGPSAAEGRSAVRWPAVPAWKLLLSWASPPATCSTAGWCWRTCGARRPRPAWPTGSPPRRAWRPPPA